MKLTLSVDEEVLQSTRKKADALGTSVNQLIRDYLAELSGSSCRSNAALELDAMWKHPTGDSKGWKFNREEIYSHDSSLP